MALNKHGLPSNQGVVQLDTLGVPMTQYIPLADVAFGGGRDPVALPHALPAQSAIFPTRGFNGMLAVPSVHVLYDERRNGIAF